MPPHPGAAWRGVFTVAVTETLSWGVLYYAFGVFIGSLQRDLGESNAAVSGAFSVGLLAAAAAAPPVGRALDRWGARRIMTAGSVLGAAAFAMLGAATELWHAYAAMLVVGASHAAVLYEPAFTAVSRWFPAQPARTRALLVVTTFGGFASTVFLPLAALASERHGWRGASLFLAVLLAVVTVPLHATLPPDAGGQRPTTTAAPARGGQALALVSALQAFASAGVTVHLVSFLNLSGLGLAHAATIAGLIGAAQVPGRLLFAPFAGWLSSGRRLPVLLATQGAALLGIVAAEGLPRAAAVALFGAANGMVTLERATLVAERYGAHEYGAISGRIARLSLVGRAAAPLAVGLAGGLGFTWAFAALGGVLLIAAAVSVR